MKKLIVLALAVLCASCGSSSSPSAPSPTTPTTTTATATGPWTLSGTVTSAAGGGIAGATIRVVDGPNAGQSTQTDGAGTYSIRLNQAGFTISISAPGFVTTTRSVTLTANATSSAALLPSQIFTKNGVGNTVFDMPTYIARVRIVGTYTGSSSNFIVHIAGRGVVNDIIGTSSFFPAISTVSDGTYVTNGGVTEILSSTGVSWTFTEVRP